VSDGDAALERLRGLVELESPSSDEAALHAVAAHLVVQLTACGAETDTVDAHGVGEHVVARIPGREPGLEPVLVLTHFDTVHPVGTFDPIFRVEDGKAFGPGVFDMKGGVACMIEALHRIRVEGTAPRRPVIFLATCDEETGSATSRALIEELAAGACAVLVPEPPLPGGRAKTRRKGVAGYRVEIQGKAAHAGLAPEAGVNAILELAHQVIAITGLADTDAGTTVSVGVTGGGTTSNVVPAAAWAVVDVRFTAAAEAGRVDHQIRHLRTVLPGARVTVSGGINRPPMERTEGVARLYERARAMAAGEGWELGEGLSGGASDGSFTAGMGIPTLDGIGPEGAGAHAVDEHVLIDDIPRRVQLYRRLFEEV
jgi:glutamate carboxypeptidase